MALVKITGSPVVLISGSIGNLTYFRNPFGYAVRSKAYPRNTFTQARATVRGKFAGIVASWQSLSIDQQSRWSSAAMTINRHNRAADIYQPTGYNYFISCNLTRSKLSLPLLSVPPINEAMIALRSFVITDANAAAIVYSASTVFGSTVTAGGYYLVIYASPSVPGDRLNQSNLYRVIKVVPPATIMSSNIIADYAAVFGAVPIPGRKAFFRAELINSADCRYLPPTTASAIFS